jgi:hypothetical protein
MQPNLNIIMDFTTVFDDTKIQALDYLLQMLNGQSSQQQVSS